jgi:hypothetical protein
LINACEYIERARLRRLLLFVPKEESCSPRYTLIKIPDISILQSTAKEFRRSLGFQQDNSEEDHPRGFAGGSGDYKDRSKGE